MSADEIIEDLKRSLSEPSLACLKTREGRYILPVPSEKIKEVIRILVEKYRARLSTISADDRGLDLDLLYHMSLGSTYINLKLVLPKEILRVSSISNIIAGASWAEREIHDLFGVEFEGHPDPRRLFLPFEWPREKNPLRAPMRGLLSPFQKPTMENLLATGQIFPILATTKRQRAKLKLVEEPPTVPAKPDALREVQQLSRAVGFDKQVGFDWKNKKMRY
jgi:Ni,Fe-hydrogenase III component G